MNSGRLSRNKVKIAPSTKIKIKANIILTRYTKLIGLDALLTGPGTPETWRKKVNKWQTSPQLEMVKQNYFKNN